MSNPNPMRGSGTRLLAIVVACLLIGYFLGVRYGYTC